MFKVVQNPQFTHRVKVMVPVDSGHREETFKATYRVLTVDKVAEYDLHDGGDSARFLRDVVVALDDIAGEDGNALPYNAEVLEAVIALPYARAALAGGYFEAVGKARRGN